MSHDLVQSLKQSVQNHYPPLSPFWNQTKVIFEQGHNIYCLFKYLEIFNQREQLKKEGKGDPVALGMGLHVFSGLNGLIPYCSELETAALIIEFAIQLFDQHAKVFHSMQNLHGACRPRSKIYTVYAYQRTRAATLFLPPSLHLKYEIYLIRLVQQCVKILRCLYCVCREMIQLTLLERDIYLVIKHGSHEAKLRACTELATKCLKYREELSRNSEFLKKQIRERLMLVNQVLKAMNRSQIPLSAIEKSENLADWTTTTCQVVKGALRQNHLGDGPASFTPPKRGKMPLYRPKKKGKTPSDLITTYIQLRLKHIHQFVSLYTPSS